MAAGNTNSAASILLRVRNGSAQPNMTEGLIWLKTDTAITSWIVSPNQPDAPEEGMVWIENGTANEINALRKNTLTVFPTNCKLYTGGQWKNVDAYLCKDSAWVQFGYDRYYLYSEGDEKSALTGGWALSTSGSRTHGEKLVKNADSMSFTSKYVDGKNYACGFLRTNNKILLAEFSTLKMEFESVTAINGTKAAATTLDKYDLIDYQSSIYAQASIYVGATEVSVDISSLNGSHYVGVYTGLYNATNVVIKNIWLE